jgi:hypothetical protein
MTPEPTDLLRGARRTLADVVLPALGDPFAIEQLKTVLRVLTHLEAVVDEAHSMEAAEADDLRRFLEAVGRSPLGEMIPAGTGEGFASSASSSYRDLRDANVSRKRVVSDVIRALRRGAPNAAVEAALNGLVQKQLERERRWTSPRRAEK